MKCMCIPEVKRTDGTCVRCEPPRDEGKKEAPSRTDNMPQVCIDVENDWQTVQDHVEDENIEDALFYLGKMCEQIEKLEKTLHMAEIKE